MPAASPEAPHASSWSRLPLAWQLTCWFSLSAFVLVGVAVILLYALLLEHFRAADRGYLLDKMAVLRSEFAASPDRDTWLRQAALMDPAVRVHTRLLIRLLDRTGKVIIATPDFRSLLPAAPAALAPTVPASAPPVVQTLWAQDGTRFLTATAPVSLDEDALGLLQVAYHNSDADRILHRYRESLLAVLAVASSACVVVGWQISRRGLRPVQRLTQATRLIGSHSLHLRLGERDVPRELVELSHAFNQMLDRLEESFRRLARFSAAIAHELRTPINNLQGMAEVALAADRSGTEYREVIASCLEECGRITHLIDTLLFLARADNPQTQLQREPVQVAEVLRILANFYHIPASDAGIRIACACPQDVVVAADRTLLHRALGNLIENAIAHTAAGGRIVLGAEIADDVVRLGVSDSGCGIPPAQLAHLGDPAWSPREARDMGHHLGLGLAIVRGTARLHGGDIAIRSTVGVGTTVELILPREPATPALTPTADPAATHRDRSAAGAASSPSVPTTTS